MSRLTAILICLGLAFFGLKPVVMAQASSAASSHACCQSGKPMSAECQGCPAQGNPCAKCLGTVGFPLLLPASRPLLFPPGREAFVSSTAALVTRVAKPLLLPPKLLS